MLYQHGRLEFTGWAVMTLVGQLAATMPLLWLTSGSAIAFALTTAGFAVVAVVASYSLARRVLSPGRAGLAVLLAILVPGFMLYTTAYMTEVPAFAMEMSCLAIGAAALERSPDAHRWRWLAASLAVGCYAFSIREYALAAPLAVLVAAAASDRGGRRSPYLVGLVLVAVAGACLSIYGFTAALPGQGGVGLEAPTPETTRRVLDAIGLLSFALAPALLIAVLRWVPHWWRSRQWLAAALGGLAGAALAVIFNLDRLLAPFGEGAGNGPDMFVGNVFTAHGTLDVGLLAGDRPVLYAAPGLGAVERRRPGRHLRRLCLRGRVPGRGASSTARCDQVSSRPTPLGSVPGMVAVFVVVFGAGTIDPRSHGDPVRSLHVAARPAAGDPAAPSAGPSVRPTDSRWGSPARRPRPGPPAARRPVRRPGRVAVGDSSLVLLLNAAAFDAARWRMGDEAVRLGFAAETVDAGFEWVGSTPPAGPS